MAPPNDKNNHAAHKRKREAAEGEPGPSKARGPSNGGRGRGSEQGRGRGRGGGRGAAVAGRGGRSGAGRGRGHGTEETDRGGKQRKVAVEEEEEEEEGDAPVGVSKLKAQLRQTRRLLKKDNVAPPVRQEAQRREKALLSEIEERERDNVEREHAKASHAARFFDRQKLVRRIGKILKKGEGVEQGDKEATLKEARVRLNYVLNWPHQHAYVALYSALGKAPLGEAMITPALSKSPSESEKLAHEVRSRIVARMQDGSLPLEPEVELLTRRTKEAEGTTRTLRLRKDDLGALDAQSEKEESAQAADVVDDDDFFAKEGESDEE